MIRALLLLAACGPGWDGTWSDGVHAPLIARTCADDAYLVFSFADKSYAASLTSSTSAAPFVDAAHAAWLGELRIVGDALDVDLNGNQFTATRADALDDGAVDCDSLRQ